jgi:hypothetical protein
MPTRRSKFMSFPTLYEVPCNDTAQTTTFNINRGTRDNKGRCIADVD